MLGAAQGKQWDRTTRTWQRYSLPDDVAALRAAKALLVISQMHDAVRFAQTQRKRPGGAGPRGARTNQAGAPSCLMGSGQSHVVAVPATPTDDTDPAAVPAALAGQELATNTTKGKAAALAILAIVPPSSGGPSPPPSPSTPSGLRAARAAAAELWAEDTAVKEQQAQIAQRQLERQAQREASQRRLQLEQQKTQSHATTDGRAPRPPSAAAAASAAKPSVGKTRMDSQFIGGAVPPPVVDVSVSDRALLPAGPYRIIPGQRLRFRATGELNHVLCVTSNDATSQEERQSPLLRPGKSWILDTSFLEVRDCDVATRCGTQGILGHPPCYFPTSPTPYRHARAPTLPFLRSRTPPSRLPTLRRVTRRRCATRCSASYGVRSRSWRHR